jgi:hypothetical protein
MESSNGGVKFCAPGRGAPAEGSGDGMSRYVFVNVLMAAAIFAALALGCDDAQDEGKLALSAVIPNPVEVTLGLATGSMEFDFSEHPLDPGEREEMKMFFIQGGIGVTVVHDATGVSYDLNDGSQVLTTPDYDGEYLVEANEDGTTVTVTFYNWIEGKTIVAGGDYSVTVDVLENDFFVTESFVRDVTAI